MAAMLVLLALTSSAFAMPTAADSDRDASSMLQHGHSMPMLFGGKMSVSADDQLYVAAGSFFPPELQSLAKRLRVVPIYGRENDANKMLQEAWAWGCSSIWTESALVREDPVPTSTGFPLKCKRMGVRWVGENMNTRIYIAGDGTLDKLAAECNIPSVQRRMVRSAAQARSTAMEIGLPVLLLTGERKWVVTNPVVLNHACAEIFVDSHITATVERFIPDAQLIELEVLRDYNGDIMTLKPGVLSSLTPESYRIDDAVCARLQGDASTIAKRIGSQGVTRVQFLIDNFRQYTLKDLLPGGGGPLVKEIRFALAYKVPLNQLSAFLPAFDELATKSYRPTSTLIGSPTAPE